METVSLITRCGEVIGEQKDGYSVFRGIPYARTPRFEMPEIITSFEDEYFDATRKEKDCYQFHAFRDDSDTFYTKEFRPGEDYEYTEDYMALNIITPDDADRAPVMVFIHGGGFETGNMGETPYGCTTEYVKHGIVYVSVGYRLNVFGFYGGVNYGHADQACAVAWVYNFISAFGGDPDRITVAGQSAGAMSLMNLVCSESLRPFVKGVIMMSGAGVIPKIAAPFSTEQSKPFWKLVREKAGAKDDEEMKKLPPEVIWNAWYDVSRSKAAKMQNLEPAMDGINPPEQQAVRMKEGKIIDVPMLVGVTSQDMFPYMIYDMALSMGLKLSKQGHAPVYGYFFDRAVPGNLYRAFHASDLWYAFGCMDKCWRPFGETDFALKEKMVKAFADFVKTGDPGWTPISKESRLFRRFDGEKEGMIGPAECRRKMWHTVLKDHGPL